MKARLYYEAHITVEAHTDPAEFETFKRALGPDFKVSRFDEDEVDGYDGKWFASARDEYLEVIEELVAEGIIRLRAAGFVVLRAKIEDTLLDTKYGDVVGRFSI